MSRPKQVIVVRTDLGMRKGKMAAQAAHASMGVFLERGAEATGEQRFRASLSDAERTWLAGDHVKIVLGAAGEEELLELARAADARGLRTHLVHDLGLTEFHGVRTLTALAIGPAEAEEIDPVTGHLRPT